MINQDKKAVDLIIVGAGVIGAAQALLLAKRFPNIRIAILDQAKQTAFPDKLNTRATALGQQAKVILEECGVWQQLPSERICEYKKMVVWDEQSQGELQFDSEELGALSLGHIVDHFALQSLLQSALIEQSGVKSYYQRTIDEIIFPELTDGNNDQSVCVKLTDGMCIESKLVIAADGAQSQVRELAGIAVRRNSYHQSGIVAVVETENTHNSTAWQRFLDSGPLAFLPLKNGDSSIVWSINDAEIETLINADEQFFCQRLESATQGYFGKITLKSARHIFPLSSQRALQYYKNNIVLIGDAAHGIHPLAGQGANLGFADIAVLSDQLTEFPEMLSRAALRRYERQRKADNYAVDTAMTLIQKGFANSAAWVSLLRGFGMNVIGRNKSLQRFLFNLASRR